MTLCDERGIANSYDLKFKVVYRVFDGEGEVIKAKTWVNESRRYDFDPEFVVETESEERELQESMEQDVALKIVRQLSISLAQSNPESAAAEAEESQADDAESEDN